MSESNSASKREELKKKLNGKARELFRKNKAAEGLDEAVQRFTKDKEQCLKLLKELRNSAEKWRARKRKSGASRSELKEQLETLVLERGSGEEWWAAPLRLEALLLKEHAQQQEEKKEIREEHAKKPPKREGATVRRVLPPLPAVPMNIFGC